MPLPPTLTDDDRDALALRLAQIACDAGRIVMESARTATAKPDGSPVTEADKASERAIRNDLRQIDASLVIVAEESFDGSGPRETPRRFVLIDPLDGTRDFAEDGNEFTVNIALIENGTPTVGVVYAPARDALYFAGARAFNVDVAPGATASAAPRRPIETRPYPAEGICALTSRSHIDRDTLALLDSLPVAAREPLSSSLKFCLVAEGNADLYARLAPTMEWDTAAGHAVLVAAGGRVLDGDGAPLRYGKPGFRNTRFLAWGREPLR